MAFMTSSPDMLAARHMSRKIERHGLGAVPARRDGRVGSPLGPSLRIPITGTGPEYTWQESDDDRR